MFEAVAAFAAPRAAAHDLRDGLAAGHTAEFRIQQQIEALLRIGSAINNVAALDHLGPSSGPSAVAVEKFGVLQNRLQPIETAMDVPDDVHIAIDPACRLDRVELCHDVGSEPGSLSPAL